ncbi:MAG TPA: ABC transporter substrate-binding protein [Gammaproteobacteria bacterium]|jgi:phospholipid transport system substrate-binding protein|nr:ABC transporter substrate-binding protein [Gammaproteobacteria bacterium]
MQKSKLIQTFMLLIFSWLCSANIYAQGQAVQSDPVALLQYIADHMITGLRSQEANLKTKPEVVYKLAYQYVVPYADLAEMSKRVLPPQTWNSATPAQRAQFEKAFTRTLIRTYASALTAYTDQTVRFYPVRGGSQGLRMVEVNSEIDSSSSQPIHVSYRMQRVGSVWRLYDMSVEGVSMLDSFRSQFADLLSSGSMDDLLQRMSTHNQGVR